ncbi:MAG: AAA family ATPase [Gammaproteobacteria bacterium]|nr:AAA family ATPase [Gammaproteobacteria bacterium]
MPSPVEPILKLSLLGGFQLFGADGVEVPIPARKAKALLALLAMIPGERRSREALASLLWEVSGDAQARHSLRQALASLRKALPETDPPILSADTDSIQVAPGTIEVDALRLEQLAESTDSQDLCRAAAMYQGEFLEGFNPRSVAFEDWLMQVRIRLHERSLAVLTSLAEEETAAGRLESATRLSLKLLSLDPLREDIHRRLMELYVRQGRHGAALRQYRICRGALERQLGVEPEAATEKLYRNLLSRRDTEAPAPELPDVATPVAGESPPPARGNAGTAELRQAAVLVTNLADFGKLAALLDAEQLYELLTRYYSRVDQVVSRCGGKVVRQFSETVMAAFGVPRTQGNDVERGLRAATEAIRAIGDTRCPGEEAALAMGAGLTTGRVLVAMSPSLAQAEPILTGAAVNEAVRLAAQARAGELLLGDSAYQGIAERVAAERVRDEGSNPGNSPWRFRDFLGEDADTGPAPIVGRVKERRQFEATLDACIETDCGQVFLVRGEAGIGKTRLVTEFMRLANGLGFLAHRALILDFGSTGAGGALRSLARQMLHLKSRTAGLSVHAAIRNAVETGMFSVDEEAALHDLLGATLPVSLKSQLDARGAAERRAGQLAALARLALRSSEVAPRLLVIEDIHWADRSTMDALARLAEVANEGRVMLVMTSRVEGEPLDPAWRGAMHGTPLTTIDLAPLGENDAMQLARSITGTDDATARHCVGRSGGNPLFLEQLLRTTRESPSFVPDSVQSIVWARLDGLSASDRQAAQAAAVLGQRFDPAPLCFLVEDEAYRLEGLLEQRLVKPESDGYLFAHALIRDGIYASILPSRRRELHLKAADWYRLRDPVLRARHLLCIGDAAAGAACLEAARRETSAWRYDSALDLIAHGLELEPEDGEGERFSLLNLRGVVLLECGRVDEALASQEAAHAAATGPLDRCRARIDAAAGLIVKDRHEDALQALAEVESTAEAAGCRDELARIHYHRGNVLFPLGRIDECLQSHKRALELARQIESRELEARALSGLGDAWYLCGRMITAHSHFDQCVRLCRQFGFGRIEMPNLAMRGICNFYRLRIDDALNDARDAARMAQHAGNPRDEALARDIVATVLITTGRHEAAFTEATRALSLTASLGAGLFHAEVKSMLGRLAAASGDMEGGIRLVLEAWDTCREHGLAYAGPMILGILARVTDDSDRRRWALEEGERLLQTDSVSHNFLYFYEAAIAVSLADGNWDAAEYYAIKLDRYTRDEPLPLSRFIIDYGRSLARAGRGERNDALRRTLAGLADQAQQAGLEPWRHDLECAMTELAV